METAVSKVNHHFSPSQLSSSVVVDLIGAEVEEEVDGRGWGEGGRFSLGRRGEIVPDSEMEFTSEVLLGEAKFVDSRPNGWACV